MVYGSYDLILPEHEQIYAFTRTLENERLLVMLNFSAVEAVFVLPGDIAITGQQLMISNYPADPAEGISQLGLRPYEARVYQLYL